MNRDDLSYEVKCLELAGGCLKLAFYNIESAKSLYSDENYIGNKSIHEAIIQQSKCCIAECLKYSLCVNCDIACNEINTNLAHLLNLVRCKNACALNNSNRFNFTNSLLLRLESQIPVIESADCWQSRENISNLLTLAKDFYKCVDKTNNTDSKAGDINNMTLE